MTTPILIAAAARKPRRNPRAVHAQGEGGYAPSAPHNYLAQSPKKQPGAPLGNRHAARAVPESEARLARLQALVRSLCTRADAAIAAAEKARP